MPDPIMIACGASLYTLIAVRVGIVYRRVSKGTESDSVFFTLCFSALWPLTAVLLGFGTMMFGDAGLYGKSGRL